MEAARVAVSLKPGTRKNVKRCPVLNLEAIEMVRGGPPRMREEAGDGNFKLQIKKIGPFLRLEKQIGHLLSLTC